MVRRYSYVAGSFYEADPERLKKQIEWCFLHPIGPGKLPQVSSERKRVSLGYVVPHAGYVYSGPVAAHSYYHLASEGKPRTIVIIGPNHTGLGTALATMDSGVWVTPLGEVEVDQEVARELVRESSYLDVNLDALMYEHSIEVQLPFLQYLYGTFKFVPIVMMLQEPEVARDLAEALYKLLERGVDLVVLASSDWTHYEPYEVARDKDLKALQKVVEVDPDGFFDVIRRLDVSACGYGPVATLLYLAKKLGVKRAVLLKYANSGDTSGFKAEVVGYAAVRVPLPGYEES